MPTSRRCAKKAVLILENSSTQRDGLGTASPCARTHAGGRRLAGLTVAATGVVYGDIGTSSLYVMREAFGAHGGLPPREAAVPGVLSLILWALLLVVTIKYVTVVMRADNQGEGSVLAPREPRPAQPARRTDAAPGALDATRFFKLPPDHVVQVGSQVEI